MFTAFIKILPVGELPEHDHAGVMTPTSLTGTINGTWGPLIDNNINANGILKVYRHGNDNCQLEAGNNNRNYFSVDASHSHAITINNTGSNMAHNNLQPYISIYIWERIS